MKIQKLQNNANVSSEDKNTEEYSSETNSNEDTNTTNSDTPSAATKPNEKVTSSGDLLRDLENNAELLNSFDYILDVVYAHVYVRMCVS